MQRVRRLASIAVVASLSVAGLAACRSSPQVAAYVGSDRITEDRVTKVLDDAKANQAAGAETAAIKRQDVVDTLVGLDVLQQVAKQRGVSAAAVSADTVAQSLGLKTNAELVGLTVQYHGLFSALTNGVQAATPTQADLRDVYDKLTAGGANPSNTSFQAFASSISQQDQTTLGQNIGLRNALQPAISKVDTTVNPKYVAPELTLVSTQGSGGGTVALVSIDFGQGGGTGSSAKGDQSTVIDVS